MTRSSDNLGRLADYIEMNVGQAQLDMKRYRSAPFNSLDDCGSVGCALGWAPFTPGLELLDSEFGEFDGRGVVNWHKYFERIFPVQRQHNIRLMNKDVQDGKSLYSVAFSSDLSSRKNLVVGRIRHAAHQIANGAYLLKELSE